LPLDVASIAGTAARIAFEETLQTELMALSEQFSAVLQSTAGATTTCSGADEDYEFVTLAEAKANAGILCALGNAQGMTNAYVMAVGVRGGPGIKMSGCGCTLGVVAECGCSASGTCLEAYGDTNCLAADAGNAEQCVISACKLISTQQRFEITSVYDPYAGLEEPTDGSPSPPPAGQTAIVEIEVVVGNSDSQDSPSNLIDKIQTAYTNADSTVIGVMNYMSTATAVERILITPEPEPLPAPEPDPDGIITRSHVVISMSSPPVDWNNTMQEMVGALGLGVWDPAKSTAPGLCVTTSGGILASMCLESWTFGITSVAMTLYEGEAVESKMAMSLFSANVASLSGAGLGAQPGNLNVTSVVQNNIYIDTSGPAIALLGPNPLRVDIYQKYVEPGASAFDNMDGEWTHKLNISAAVNIDVAGTYPVTYTAVDSTGNIRIATRTVEVVDIYNYRVGQPHSPFAIIGLRIELDLNFEFVEDPGSQLRQAFDKQFPLTLATVLGIPASRIQIPNTGRRQAQVAEAQNGGTVVNVLILPDAGGNELPIAAIEGALGAQGGPYKTYLQLGGAPLKEYEITSAACDFNRTVTEQGFMVITGRDGRRYAPATRETQTWLWPYAIPESYYTSNLRQNRTYHVRVRAVSALGAGQWTEMFDVVTPAGKNVLEGDHIFGCQDPLALNYNARATYGDGSCVFKTLGRAHPRHGGIPAICRAKQSTIDTSALTNTGEEGVEACAAVTALADNTACMEVINELGAKLCQYIESTPSRDAVHGWDGDDGSIFVVGGSRANFTGRAQAAHQNQPGYRYPLSDIDPHVTFQPTVVPDNGTESGRDDYTDYPTHQNFLAGGGPGEGIEGYQQLAREARQRGDYYTDAFTADHGPWATWSGHPGNSSHTAQATGPAQVITHGNNIHNVFATANQEETTNYGTNAYGDQVGPGPEAWNTGGDALSGQQAFNIAAQIRAETIQQTLRDTRSDDMHRLVRGEPWGHRPGYGGKLGGSDPDLDLGQDWASGSRTHPTGIPRRLRDPEYRIYHGLAVRGMKTPWNHNLTHQDIQVYRDMDINAVRIGFQWDNGDPDWKVLGRRYMTFRACVNALNATALNQSWVSGFENRSTQLDRVAGATYKKGRIGYGDIADTGLDRPRYDPTAAKSDRLMDGLFGGQAPEHGGDHGPNTYHERWGGSPLPAPEPLPEPEVAFAIATSDEDLEELPRIAQGLLQPFTSCDDVMITVHIFVDIWGEDITWQVDGGTVFGPYPNVRGHYYEAFYLPAGEHNITYSDRRGNGWCTPGWDEFGPDGYGEIADFDGPASSTKRCGYWDVADDTGRVLSGGPIAGMVHGSGGQSPFTVPSRCAAGSEIGTGGERGHRVSSAWNVTEYNELMMYCQERVYINCSITPEHCDMVYNQTDGSLMFAIPNYGLNETNPDEQPLGFEELGSEPGVPVNFLLTDADTEDYDFSLLKNDMLGPDFTNRPYYDRAGPYSGAEKPMYDPKLGARPYVAPEQGIPNNHRLDPLQPTAVIPPGDDETLVPTTHGVKGGARPAFVSAHHDGPMWQQKPMVPYDNNGIWPGSRLGTSVDYGSEYTTGLGNAGGLEGDLGVDGSFTHGHQITQADHYVGGTTRTGRESDATGVKRDGGRRMQSNGSESRGVQNGTVFEPTYLQIKFVEAELLAMTPKQLFARRRVAVRRQMANVARGELRALRKWVNSMDGIDSRRSRRRQQSIQQLGEQLAHDHGLKPAPPPPRHIPPSFPDVPPREFIPDSVFDGQIWSVNEHGYKPKATHYPVNPGYTDHDLVGLKNNQSEIIPDSMRANVENAGFYEVPESWHGVAQGVASPGTTTNPWWMDEWASGGKPSQDQPRDLTMEMVLEHQRLGGYYGYDGVKGLYLPGAAGTDSCMVNGLKFFKNSVCDEPSVLDPRPDPDPNRDPPLEFPESARCPTGTDRTDCREALAQAVVKDQFVGGAATHWIDDFPSDGTGYNEDVTSWPTRDYVDPSQNSEYGDRQDARTDVMYGTEVDQGVLEAGQALANWMDQMYIRDMRFEEIMEERRQAERDRLAKEAEMKEAANARRKAEMLAKLRGAGMKQSEWDWIREEDVGPDGDMTDPLFCHGLSYEQCNYKISRQNFISIPGVPSNMTEFMYANNLTANYTEYVYQPVTHWADQDTTVATSPTYNQLCANRGTGIGTGPGQSKGQPFQECISEMTVYVGDTIDFEWGSYGTVHVAEYFPDLEADCPAQTNTPKCPMGAQASAPKPDCCLISSAYPLGHDSPNCPAPFYWDSGDLAGDGTGNDPDLITAGSYSHTFIGVEMEGTYCIGSRQPNAFGGNGNRLVLRVKVHPCDASKVGRGSPCDPPAPDPICNATLDMRTHATWRRLTGLQQYKLQYIWMQNYTTWNRETVTSHGGKFTGYNTIMPKYPIPFQSGAGDGTFTGETTMKPGYLYNMTRVPPAYVNYSVIPGYMNTTSMEWIEEQYVNGTWLNESWVCEDQITLIPNRMPCWTGYFKRVTNTGVHNGHSSGASYACMEPSNIYDTVSPYYFDQLNEWKDKQMMYPPIVWELVETLEAKGVKVILDSHKHMEPHEDYPGYPHCGYGVQGDFQARSDIYACFVPTNQPSNLRRRYSPGGWHRETWGYDKRYGPGDPVYGGNAGQNAKRDADSEYYRRVTKDHHDAAAHHTVRRKQVNQKTRPYVYPEYIRRQEAQAYYTNLDNTQSPMYIPGVGNVNDIEEMRGGTGPNEFDGPRFPTVFQQDIVSGGRFVNPHGTWGATTDHESYADGMFEAVGSTDYEALLSHDERPLGSPSTRPSLTVPSLGPNARPQGRP